jgi:glycosyltransferase involved in cell wall biosynthesis
MPEVSVLMTAYNREKFILESIESVTQSTFKNLELIIVDDGSKDNTVELVRQSMQKDSRILLYQNENNLGDYPNRNQAASYAKGKYILYVDSDDQIQPDAIAYCMKYFEAFPEADFSVIYPHGDIQTPMMLNSEAAIRKHFYEKSFLNLGPGGVVFKRDFFLKNNSYNTRFGPANDLYSHLKFAIKGNVLLLPFKYLIYRIHDGQESTNRYRYLYLNQLYINAAFSKLDFPLTEKEKKKIKKRYTRNNALVILKYILKTFKIRKGIEAYLKAEIKFRDLI